MKIQCNVCEEAEATVLCCADEAALCWACDEKVHAANKLAGKHQREASGFFFCLRDRALLSKLSASGMLVQDPSKESKHDDVDEIFNQARQLGDVEGPLERPSSSRSFTGIGRLLSGESVPTALQQPDPVIHNIIFWSNGFTVDDGPLRKLDDPENASFVDSIRKSECPKELEPADKRAAVHVNLMRRDENCPEKEKLKVAFEGVGRTLGGASSSTSSSLSNLIDAAAVPSPSQSLVVDETLPSTSIQLRLADGTRMVAKFNNHHTVKDIRAFIDISRPGNPNTYILQVMGFPPKPLSDPSQTIDQACLANSVVIQKF